MGKVKYRGMSWCLFPSVILGSSVHLCAVGIHVRICKCLWVLEKRIINVLLLALLMREYIQYENQDRVVIRFSLTRKPFRRFGEKSNRSLLQAGIPAPVA